MRKQYSFILAILSFLLFSSTSTSFADFDSQDQEKLQGVWAVVGFEQDGISIPREQAEALSLLIIFDENRLLHKRNGHIVNEATYSINPGTSPKELDTTDKNGRKELGIYQLEKNSLVICVSVRLGKQRPLKFATEPDSGYMLFNLRRINLNK